MKLGYYKYYFVSTVEQMRLKYRLRQVDGVLIAKNVSVCPDLKIAARVRIGAGAVIGEKVILEGGVVIGSSAKIDNISVDENTCIESGVIVTGCGSGKITVGKESYIGINNILDWSDNIVIGNYVHIAGPSTGLWTHSSAKQALNGLHLSDKNEEFRVHAPIIIEDNVYIGGNSTVYPGVRIGHHSVVAPNSAVTKDVPPFTMVGGAPAHKIKDIIL